MLTADIMIKMAFLSKNKKGNLILTKVLGVILDLALIAMVIIVLFAFVYNGTDYSKIEAAYIAKDVALLMGSLYAAPGNIYINYSSVNINISDYDLRIGENIVEEKHGRKGITGF